MVSTESAKVNLCGWEKKTESNVYNHVSNSVYSRNFSIFYVCIYMRPLPCWARSDDSKTAWAYEIK